MLAYSLKEILDLLPEALPLVKEAHIDQDLPLGNRDSCIASALHLKYHETISYKPVDSFEIEKVAKAVRLYDVGDIVGNLCDKLVKAAAERSRQRRRDPKAEYLAKEASFIGDRGGFPDVIELSKRAGELYKEAAAAGVEPSGEVIRYSGRGWLDKEAALRSLAARYEATKNPDFVKIAAALNKLDTLSFLPAETVQSICTTVAEMDKLAGISVKGFNFFREAVLTKQAEMVSALHVNLCGKKVPYESIARVGRDRIAQYIGEDVAKEMDAGPGRAKEVIETLPLDLQRLVQNLTVNV